MKIQKIVSYFFILVMIAGSAISCKDDAIKATLKSTVTANSITTPATDQSVVLVKADADKDFTFAWTATDFGFPASVTYKIQMAFPNTNFTPFTDILTANTVLTASIKKSVLNDKLIGFGLLPNASRAVVFRIVSSVNDKVATTTSATINATFTPYATSFPPIYAMGDALNGWGPNWGGINGNEVEFPSFINGSGDPVYKKYENYVYLINGKIFRFFEQQDWGPTSYSYPYFTTVDANLALNPADGDNNFKVVGASGWYKMTVDLAAKTLAMATATEPTMYIVGSGCPAAGWSWNTPVKMTFKKPGVFQVTAGFIGGAGNAFRFFPTNNDWGTSFNYPYFTTVASIFVNANDGDKNLQLVGADGSYTISVDITNKKVTKL